MQSRRLSSVTRQPSYLTPTASSLNHSKPSLKRNASTLNNPSDPSSTSLNTSSGPSLTKKRKLNHTKTPTTPVRRDSITPSSRVTTNKENAMNRSLEVTSPRRLTAPSPSKKRESFYIPGKATLQQSTPSAPSVLTTRPQNVSVSGREPSPVSSTTRSIQPQVTSTTTSLINTSRETSNTISSQRSARILPDKIHKKRDECMRLQSLLLQTSFLNAKLHSAFMEQEQIACHQLYHASQLLLLFKQELREKEMVIKSRNANQLVNSIHSHLLPIYQQLMKQLVQFQHNYRDYATTLDKSRHVLTHCTLDPSYNALDLLWMSEESLNQMGRQLQMYCERVKHIKEGLDQIFATLRDCTSETVKQQQQLEHIQSLESEETSLGIHVVQENRQRTDPYDCSLLRQALEL